MPTTVGISFFKSSPKGELSYKVKKCDDTYTVTMYQSHSFYTFHFFYFNRASALATASRSL